MMMLFSLHKFVEQSCWHYDCLWFCFILYKPFEQPVFVVICCCCCCYCSCCYIWCYFIDVISFKNDTRIGLLFLLRCRCVFCVFSLSCFFSLFSRQSFRIETSTCLFHFLCVVPNWVRIIRHCWIVKYEKPA